MIGNALRMDIETYAGEIDRSVLFAATRAGKMTRESIARYVGGLHFMLTMTPIHLRRAHAKALAAGDVALAAHFGHKLGEEVGHDVWAENDLKALEAQHDRADVSPATRAMARNNERMIDANPSLYLAYIAFSEYITVMLGPRWLEALETRCGIPRSSMTAVGNHAEVDRAHAEEGFAVMDDLITDPKMLAPMREALESAMVHYELFCVEMVGALAAESGLIPAADESQRHVSAA